MLCTDLCNINQCHGDAIFFILFKFEARIWFVSIRGCQSPRITIHNLNHHFSFKLMAVQKSKGACYVVNINDGNLLVEVGSYQAYAEALEGFDKTVQMGSFGRWKEVYLEGRDRAGQFIDVYSIHYFVN